MISLFMTFSDPAGKRRVRLDALDAAAVLVGAIPQMTEGLLFTPLEQPVHHPTRLTVSGQSSRSNCGFRTCSLAKTRWTAAERSPASRLAADYRASPDWTSPTR